MNIKSFFILNYMIKLAIKAAFSSLFIHTKKELLPEANLIFIVVYKNFCFEFH